MSRGPLYEKNEENDYKPSFSGHETFYLRYGWLKKVYDEAEKSDNQDIKEIFSKEDAIATFGVGKNMVNSMRFWSEKSNILESDEENNLKISKLANIILDNKNDPYMENPASSWLIHWELASNPELTSCFYIFNNYLQPDIDKQKIQKQIFDLAEQQGWKTPSPATVKKDIDCYVQMYSSQTTDKSIEEQMSSALSELGLIVMGENKKNYLSRGPKPSLSLDVFAYALIKFWKYYDHSSKAISTEALTYEPGSPGRIFLLGEDDVINYMYDIKKVIKELEFNESAGLRQIVSTIDVGNLDEMSIIKKMYKKA